MSKASVLRTTVAILLGPSVAYQIKAGSYVPDFILGKCVDAAEILTEELEAQGHGDCCIELAGAIYSGLIGEVVRTAVASELRVWAKQAVEIAKSGVIAIGLTETAELPIPSAEKPSQSLVFTPPTIPTTASPVQETTKATSDDTVLEHDPEPEAEVETTSETDVSAESESEAQAEPEPEVAAEPEAEIQAEPEPVVEAGRRSAQVGDLKLSAPLKKLLMENGINTTDDILREGGATAVSSIKGIGETLTAKIIAEAERAATASA